MATKISKVASRRISKESGSTETTKTEKIKKTEKQEIRESLAEKHFSTTKSLKNLKSRIIEIQKAINGGIKKFDDLHDDLKGGVIDTTDSEKIFKLCTYSSSLFGTSYSYDNSSQTHKDEIKCPKNVSQFLQEIDKEFVDKSKSETDERRAEVKTPRKSSGETKLPEESRRKSSGERKPSVESGRKSSATRSDSATVKKAPILIAYEDAQKSLVSFFDVCKEQGLIKDDAEGTNNFIKFMNTYLKDFKDDESILKSLPLYNAIKSNREAGNAIAKLTDLLIKVIDFGENRYKYIDKFSDSIKFILGNSGKKHFAFADHPKV